MWQCLIKILILDFEWNLADVCFAFSHDFDIEPNKIWQVWQCFSFRFLSLFGRKTQAKLVDVSTPRKKMKETVTQISIKLSDGVSHNSDIKMLKLGKLNSVLRENHFWQLEALQERGISFNSSLWEHKRIILPSSLSCLFRALSWNDKALTCWEPCCISTAISSCAYCVPPLSLIQTHLLIKHMFQLGKLCFQEAFCLLNLPSHPQAGVEVLKIAGFWQNLECKHISALKYLAEGSVCSSTKYLYLDIAGSYCCYVSLYQSGNFCSTLSEAVYQYWLFHSASKLMSC